MRMLNRPNYARATGFRVVSLSELENAAWPRVMRSLVKGFMRATARQGKISTIPGRLLQVE